MKTIAAVSIGDPEKNELGVVELLDRPVPEPADYEVRIKVAYAGICGSDAHIVKGNLGPLREAVESMLPMRLGHEISGVVDKVGKSAKEFGFQPGDRITANYTHFCGVCYYCHNGQENFCEHPIPYYDGMSEYVCWHVSQLVKIPDEVPLIDAALTEPLSIAMNAVRTARVRFGSKVTVFGGGGIGLMIVQLARLAGASRVTLFEVVESKRETGLKLGADAAIDPLCEDAVKEALSYTDGGRGYDCIIESSGASSAAKMSLDLYKPEADGVYFSMYDPNFDLSVNMFTKLYMQGIHIHGMMTSSHLFQETASMLGRIDFAPIVQGVYALDQYKEAFRDQLSGKFAKLLIRCNELD
jgi:(R,R)-butanediol dehydrogenase/meso-butanediol dehydrogenase/diacetyl reductase/L-iditol 2-dehydrogenase